MTLVVRQGGLFVQLNYSSVQFILVPKLNQPEMIRVVQDKALCCTFKTSVCVFTCPLQCVTLTIPARGWAATPPLKTLEWPSSRSSRFLRGTTGTASWRYLSCGRVGFSCRKPSHDLSDGIADWLRPVFVNIGAAAALGDTWNWNGGHLKCLVIDKNVIIT